MGRYKLVEVAADTPFERGRQYGEQAAENIKHNIETYHKVFRDRKGVDWAYAIDRAKRFEEYVQTIYPWCIEEIRGIAEGAGVAASDIMVLNCRYELLRPAPKECTTGAALRGATANGHNYVFKNWDIPWGDEAALLIRVDEMNGTRYFGFTEAGQLIREGMNNHGIGFCCNGLNSTNDRPEICVPQNIFRRNVIRAKSVSEARQVLNTGKRHCSCNYLVASDSGEAVDFETSPMKVYEMASENGVIGHGNRFLAAHGIEWNVYDARGERMKELLLRGQGTIDVSYIKECLSDHHTMDPSSIPEAEMARIVARVTEAHGRISSQAICRHIDPDLEDHSKQDHTAASFIFDLTAKKAYVCKSNPCENEFIEYSL